MGGSHWVMSRSSRRRSSHSRSASRRTGSRAMSGAIVGVMPGVSAAAEAVSGAWIEGVERFLGGSVAGGISRRSSWSAMSNVRSQWATSRALSGVAGVLVLGWCVWGGRAAWVMMRARKVSLVRQGALRRRAAVWMRLSELTMRSRRGAESRGDEGFDERVRVLASARGDDADGADGAWESAGSGTVADKACGLVRKGASRDHAGEGEDVSPVAGARASLPAVEDVECVDDECQGMAFGGGVDGTWRVGWEGETHSLALGVCCLGVGVVWMIARGNAGGGECGGGGCEMGWDGGYFGTRLYERYPYRFKPDRFKFDCEAE